MGAKELPKSYDPKLAEQSWYSIWEKRGYFVADSTSTRPRFSTVIPPPNVTGSLHMGHALQHTLYDILVRWKRMCGYNTLWLPGTDHASIAVHFVLDKQLETQKKTRFDLGRGQFLRLAWEWKQASGGAILDQMRRLGVSCDWSRERFTMDEGLSRAVREVFVRLYEAGLIYRGEYIVNWCPRCKTAISDLEVVYVALTGKLWHIKYPIKGESGHLTVATTRPETMLGDTALAVHPEDERYHAQVGKTVILPLLLREIPIISDTFVEREFGTGVVKVTPAHDPNDYEASLRHRLPRVTVIDEDGKMTAEAGPYAGMERFACRQRVVEHLGVEGFLAQVEDYEHKVGQCDRCSSIVEPKISIQWYLRIAPLAEPAIEAVRKGRVEFIPDTYKDRYFDWMHNIHDWCISRQLWWGHRIPAWFCDDCGEIVVSRETPLSCPRCSGGLREETDILDTWFSSALWPFSTLGWPEDTQDLRVFYPTDVLITGPDIIFYWVARMIMMGLKFMGDVPFRQVHINGIVRDARRKKMSKTSGNVINPLDLIDQYGADAVRFTLSSMAVPGTDIPFSSQRMEGYREFANKIWQASRFVILNLRESDGPVDDPEMDALLLDRESPLQLEDRWILHRLNETTAEISEQLDKFRFHEASQAIYQFFWHELCDWYIELVKPVFGVECASTTDRDARMRVVIHIMDSVLRLLHPFMPFVTEEIWQRLPHGGESIMLADFPRPRETRDDATSSLQMGLLMELSTAIRSVRSELKVEPKRELDAVLALTDPEISRLVMVNRGKIRNLCRLRSLELMPELPGNPSLFKGVSRIGTFGLDLKGEINLQAERDRLKREMERIGAEIEKIGKKIADRDFLTRAPETVVRENRARHAELLERFQKLQSNLNGLASQ